MFRNYPLTTLFVVATICVDLALLVTAERYADEIDLSAGLRFYLFSFGIPSQLSVLALWAVFGKFRPLTKAAWVTLAGGAILLMHWILLAEMLLDEHVFFNLLQVILILAGALFFRIIGLGKPDKSADQTFQFSLVEMFGWTMIVAFWAFAFRASAGRLLIDRYFVIWLVAATVAPLIIAPVLFSNLSATLRLIGLVGAYLATFLINSITRSFFYDDQIITWSLMMAIAQITYITAWWAVVRMDEVVQERRVIAQPLPPSQDDSAI